jgi:hypothetical protein
MNNILFLWYFVYKCMTYTDCISEMTICLYKNSFQFQLKLFYWYFHFSLSQDWDLTDTVPMKIMIMKLNQMVTNIKK